MHCNTGVDLSGHDIKNWKENHKTSGKQEDFKLTNDFKYLSSTEKRMMPDLKDWKEDEREVAHEESCSTSASFLVLVLTCIVRLLNRNP